MTKRPTRARLHEVVQFPADPTRLYGLGIVDCNGDPLTEYHGTAQQMDSVCTRLNDTPHLMGMEFKPFRVVPVFYRAE